MQKRKSAARNRVRRVLGIAESKICGRMVAFETPKIRISKICGKQTLPCPPARGMPDMTAYGRTLECAALGEHIDLPGISAIIIVGRATGLRKGGR